MKTLWTLPMPSSGRDDGPDIQVRPGRECVLAFECEDSGAVTHYFELIFANVKSFRCTYLHALTTEMIESYDRLDDVGDTSWLEEVRSQTVNYLPNERLRHLRICFDDGPCYEFICEGFDVSART